MSGIGAWIDAAVREFEATNAVAGYARFTFTIDVVTGAWTLTAQGDAGSPFKAFTVTCAYEGRGSTVQSFRVETW